MSEGEQGPRCKEAWSSTGCPSLPWSPLEGKVGVTITVPPGNPEQAAGRHVGQAPGWVTFPLLHSSCVTPGKLPWFPSLYTEDDGIVLTLILSNPESFKRCTNGSACIWFLRSFSYGFCPLLPGTWKVLRNSRVGKGRTAGGRLLGEIAAGQPACTMSKPNNS